jgi:histidinol-phosphate aminotransferase
MITPKKSVTLTPPYTPPKGIREGFIRLDFNENTVGCSPRVIKRIKSISSEFLSIYPNYVGLDKKVAKYFGVKPNELLVANGSDAALKLIFDCYVEEDQEAIILEPSFGMYQFLLGLNGAKIKKVQYNTDFSFPLEQLLNSISKKTRVIVLCNPNNPTGTAITKSEIMQILKKAKNSLVLIDEAYASYSGGGNQKLIKKYNNLVITRTFSKEFGLAALRVGVILANKKIIEYLKRAYGPFEVNSIAKIALEAALDEDSLQYVDKYVAQIKKNKLVLERRLKNLGIKVYPSKGNFFVALFTNPKKVKEKLLEKKILVRDYGKRPLMENCLRITVGTKKQNEILFQIIKKFVGARK